MFARRSMFAKRSRRGPVVAGGLLVAGTAVLLASGHGPWASPKASINGAPLGGASAGEVAAFANLADQTPLPGQRIGPGGAGGAGLPATAAGGAGLIDLDKITRQGDEYIAPLADGRRAVLTLDPRLQTMAEKLLDQSRAPRAAIVAMAPDGKILALAGRRTAEPTGAIKGTFDWRLATDVWAPSASIFKLVTASALVRAGVDPDDKVCFHGGLRSVVEHNLRDDPKRDRRCESLSYGVAHSQNAILGKLAFQKLEPSALEAEAQLLGWTAPFTGEVRGLSGELALPQTRDLEFARAAAGFTGAKLSVLGGAVLAATFADEGEQPVARLIASIDGTAVPAPKARRSLPTDTARTIARMMVGTCDGGSAARVFGKSRKVRVAGKTGTLTQTTPFHIEHSWFVGFAPADKPEIVVSVLIGNAIDWHIRGHEAARRLIDRALDKGADPASARGKDRKASADGTAERAPDRTADRRGRRARRNR